MLSSRLNAFVIPTSHTTPSGIAIQGECTSCTCVPVERTTAAAPTCAASFANRRQRDEVVDKACDEEDRRAGEDPDELLAGGERP